MNLPILLLAFNRPEHFKRVIYSLKPVRPLKVYIAVDGPRKNYPEDIKSCKEVQECVNLIDWDCEVFTLFRDENLGLKLAVSQAITWFFEQEEMGVILEDDCICHSSFFYYCQELLIKYQDNDKIMTISGNNFQPKRRSNNSYYFSKYMHCWGWATWKRAWCDFKMDISDWDDQNNLKLIDNMFSNNKDRVYWKRIFDRVNRNEVNSWAYRWTYSIWKNKGINILPEKNLVSNIGFGELSTNTSHKKSVHSNLPSFEMEFPLKHPESIQINHKADNYTQRHHFNKTFLVRVLDKLRYVLKNL